MLPMGKKRILLPLFAEYYIFDYFRFLVPQLLKDGFDVTIVTFDPAVKKRYDLPHAHLQILEGPLLLKGFLGRSGNGLCRCFLWISAWILAMQLRRRYDFALVPWDYKPVWYVIARLIPSLTCHNSIEIFDVERCLEFNRFVPRTVRQKKVNSVFLVIDRFLGGISFLDCMGK